MLAENRDGIGEGVVRWRWQIAHFEFHDSEDVVGDLNRIFSSRREHDSPFRVVVIEGYRHEVAQRVSGVNTRFKLHLSPMPSQQGGDTVPSIAGRGEPPPERTAAPSGFAE